MQRMEGGGFRCCLCGGDVARCGHFGHRSTVRIGCTVLARIVSGARNRGPIRYFFKCWILVQLGYKRAPLQLVSGFLPSPSPSGPLRKFVHHFVRHLLMDSRNFWRPRHRRFLRRGALHRSFIFCPYRRISVREAPRITWLVFFDDFLGRAFTRGKVSFSVLINAPHYGFLA